MLPIVQRGEFFPLSPKGIPEVEALDELTNGKGVKKSHHASLPPFSGSLPQSFAATNGS
jgi:hypothetical protein